MVIKASISSRWMLMRPRKTLKGEVDYTPGTKVDLINSIRYSLHAILHHLS